MYYVICEVDRIDDNKTYSSLHTCLSQLTKFSNMCASPAQMARDVADMAATYGWHVNWGAYSV